MNTTQNLEARITDYYETEAPPRAPDWLLTRAFDVIDTTPQRRTTLGRPWRFPSMRSIATLALVAVAVIAVGVAGLTVPRLPSVGPAATASVPPSALPLALPPPLTERFDSTFNGISMNYPAGWRTRPATERWTDGVINFDAPGVDIIFDPTRGNDLYFALATAPLSGRHEVTLPWCPGGHGGGWRTFDGASGWVVTCGGHPVGRHSAGLQNDTHDYTILLYLGDVGLVDTYDGRWFVSVLETLDLRAEDAPGASNASEAP